MHARPRTLAGKEAGREEKAPHAASHRVDTAGERRWTGRLTGGPSYTARSRANVGTTAPLCAFQRFIAHSPHSAGGDGSRRTPPPPSISGHAIGYVRNTAHTTHSGRNTKGAVCARAANGFFTVGAALPGGLSASRGATRARPLARADFGGDFNDRSGLVATTPTPPAATGVSRDAVRRSLTQGFGGGLVAASKKLFQVSLRRRFPPGTVGDCIVDAGQNGNFSTKGVPFPCASHFT
jgi:hypothetical protein